MQVKAEKVTIKRTCVEVHVTYIYMCHSDIAYIHIQYMCRTQYPRYVHIDVLFLQRKMYMTKVMPQASSVP